MTLLIKILIALGLLALGTQPRNPRPLGDDECCPVPIPPCPPNC